MDEHLGKVNAAAKEHKDQSEPHNDNAEKSEISSLLYKGSSAFGDSAYSSLGHSAYSSNGPINPPNSGFSNRLYAKYQNKNKNGSSNPSSKSSGLSFDGKQTLVSPKNDSQALSSDNREQSVPQNIKHFKKEPSPPKPGFPSSQDSKAAKVASLSKALCYIDQFRHKKKKSEKSNEANELTPNQVDVSQTSKLAFPSNESNRCSPGSQERVPSNPAQSEKDEGDGFCVAVSLQDGMVIHTTNTLSSVLGYPKDMWIGRSFIDFVHPKDREVFISEVTKNVSLPANNINQSGRPTPGKNITNSKSDNFFCRIRRYNGLKSGFAVKERKTKYSSFKLCICFSEVNTDTSEDDLDTVPGMSIFLFITAIPLQSAYSSPNQEGPIITKCGQEVFISKHTSSCIFTFLDENSISFLGYFPQDLQGTEIFEHIHPNDLPIIKESCEKIMFGKNFKSQPYRIKTRNGDFIHVNTVWSCFVNPWSQQLEFIHGKHTVMRGPQNPNVFLDPESDCTRKFSNSENTHVQNFAIQAEIKMILQMTVSRNHLTESIGGAAMKSTKELSSFMGSLLQEVAKAENIELSRAALAGKVVIGNISPHRSDSSATPPSYTQLTYNENLTRFFNSQPKTLSEKDMLTGFVYSPASYEDNIKEPPNRKPKETKAAPTKGSGSGHVEDGGRSAGGSGHGSGEQHGSGTGQTVSGSGEDNAKNSSSLQIGLSAGHIQPGGEECMLSQDGCTSGSGSRLGSGSREGIEDAYKPPALTEELLVIHNRDMEKNMLTKFKEAKRIGETRFLKDGGKSKAAQESGSKRVPKDIIKLKEEKGESGKRKHSSKPEAHLKMSVPDNVQKGDQRSLAFNDFHWSSSSGMGTPLNINGISQRPDHEGNMSFPAGHIIQGVLPGYQNFIHVPTVYVPISHPGSIPPVMLPNQVPIGLMVDDPTQSFIPIQISDTVAGFMNPRTETKASDSESDSLRKSTVHQSKLPDCLAVNSCMELLQHQEKLQEIATPTSLIKNRRIRIKSRDGSHHTSIKGEPGSALESNASAGASVKELFTVPAIKETDNECSSSQSLYSFLQSCDENNRNDFTSVSSRSLNASPEDCKVISPRLVAKPLLSEPFWNENVKLNDHLIYKYQLEEQAIEEVLRKDRAQILKMEVPNLVDEQLMELLADLDFDYQGIDVLFDEDEGSEEETTSADESIGENDDNTKRVKMSKEKVYLEKLNIFMEENAPFPKSEINSLNKNDGSFKKSNVAYGNTSASFKHLETFGNSQSSSGVSQNVCTQTIFEKVFENAVEKSSGSRNQHGDNHSFTSNRPQDKRFRYGRNSDSSSPIEPEKEKNKMDTVSKENKKEIHTSVKTSEEVKSSDNTDDTYNSDEQTIRKKEVVDSRNKKVLPCERSPHEDHHKIQQDKRFRYGSPEASQEKDVTQKKKEKGKERRRSENVSKTGYAKTSSPKTGAQDPRLKQSTDESESSVEYLITSSSAETDRSSDEQIGKKSPANTDISDMSISIISPEKEAKDNPSEHESDSDHSEQKEAKEYGLQSESTMSLDVSGQSGKL